jgi:hypothetical protein
LNKTLTLFIVESLYEIEAIFTFGGSVVDHLCLY